VPKHVEFRAELPKSDNGKIDRRAIAAAEKRLEAAE
jgi:long-chain acyl-CoA synthetase